MKKVMIAVLSFLMLVCVSLLVEGNNFDFELVISHSQNEKIKIKNEDPPDTTRSTFHGDAFKGWVVENVYKLNNGQFEIDAKKRRQLADVENQQRWKGEIV